MKKISEFLIKLKPYKRLYKMFWMILTITSLLVFQIFMLSLSYVVPHANGGFHYWFKGLHSLLGESRHEPNSSQGFIFAATIIGYIPIIPIIPFLYFTFTNWLIQEKLSDKFIDVPKSKYLYWSTFIHFSAIALVFLIIPGLLTYLGGGGILPHQAFIAVENTFSDNVGERIAAISGILYYSVGCLFATIIIFWVIWMMLSWVGKQFQKLIDMFNNWRYSRKEMKRELKLQKLEAKANKKKKQE
ncbi:hypothetical protein [Spiroplasma endosymbiont of Cantharis lateralis]|uniref:hypothetical protein n=1 Tax=Spiroplasma endosymbiont of Cantharis lateralis TaxID=3066277 RepID=UPI00313EF353